MKHRRPGLLGCCALLWMALSIGAQELAPQPAAHPGAAATELQHIEAKRAQETAAFDAAEAACYERFAVSGCLKEVLSQRRAMLAQLRREEAALHEQDLAERGAEQQRLTAQKVQERQQMEADLQADNSARRAADKLQAQTDKREEHAAKAKTPETGAAGAGAGAGAASASASAPSVAARSAASVAIKGGLSAAEQASTRASFARKQADAAKKRQDVAKRLADKGQGAMPLPLAP